MTARFRFLEDVALADSAFEATGDNPSELFHAASQALVESMVNPTTVTPSWSQRIERQDEDLSSLLFDWLTEIVFLKDAKGLVFLVPSVIIWHDPAPGCWRLEARLEGEPIDQDRHELRSDVKAITKHLYEVRQDGNRWIARVVLDI